MKDIGPGMMLALIVAGVMLAGVFGATVAAVLQLQLRVAVLENRR